MNLNLVGSKNNDDHDDGGSEEEQPTKLTGRFSAQELHYNNLLKDLQIKKVYEKIADDCFRKIERANETIKRDFTEYKVPFTFMGEKDYNFSECLCHIIFTLRKAGFYVRYFAPNTLYICWPDYEKMEKEQKKIKFLEYEHKKSHAILKTEGTVRPKAKDDQKRLQNNPHANEDILNKLRIQGKPNFLALPGPDQDHVED